MVLSSIATFITNKNNKEVKAGATIVCWYTLKNLLISLSNNVKDPVKFNLQSYSFLFLTKWPGDTFHPFNASANFKGFLPALCKTLGLIALVLHEIRKFLSSIIPGSLLLYKISFFASIIFINSPLTKHFAPGLGLYAFIFCSIVSASSLKSKYAY